MRLIFAALAFCALLTVSASAHGDEIHVIGTLNKVSDGGVSVTGKDGKIVQVAFNEKTVYLRLKKPITKGDLKIGDRVVIHAVKIKDSLVAHTIEIGAMQH